MNSTPRINPIETVYNGIRFRSRLEARWAVFFDALKIQWEYEPEAYALPSGNYLPDFRIVEGEQTCTWVEVKPRGAPVDPRWGELARLSGYRVVAMRDFDPDGLTAYEWEPRAYEGAGHLYDNSAMWVFRSSNGGPYIWVDYTGCGDDLEVYKEDRSPEIVRAFAYAKGYRFWG